MPLKSRTTEQTFSFALALIALAALLTSLGYLPPTANRRILPRRNFPARGRKLCWGNWWATAGRIRVEASPRRRCGDG